MKTLYQTQKADKVFKKTLYIIKENIIIIDKYNLT